MAPSKMSPSKVPGKKAGPNGSFPVGDKKHARLAIGGATRSESVGNISPVEEAKIKAAARAELGKGGGKGKPLAIPKKKKNDPADFGAGRRTFGNRSWGQFGGQGQPGQQPQQAPGLGAAGAGATEAPDDEAPDADAE